MERGTRGAEDFLEEQNQYLAKLAKKAGKIQKYDQMLKDLVEIAEKSELPPELKKIVETCGESQEETKQTLKKIEAVHSSLDVFLKKKEKKATIESLLDSCHEVQNGVNALLQNQGVEKMFKALFDKREKLFEKSMDQLDVFIDNYINTRGQGFEAVSLFKAIGMPEGGAQNVIELLKDGVGKFYKEFTDKGVSNVTFLNFVHKHREFEAFKKALRDACKEYHQTFLKGQRDAIDKNQVLKNASELREKNAELGDAIEKVESDFSEAQLRLLKNQLEQTKRSLEEYKTAWLSFCLHLVLGIIGAAIIGSMVGVALSFATMYIPIVSDIITLRPETIPLIGPVISVLASNIAAISTGNIADIAMNDIFSSRVLAYIFFSATTVSLGATLDKFISHATDLISTRKEIRSKKEEVGQLITKIDETLAKGLGMEFVKEKKASYETALKQVEKEAKKYGIELSAETVLEMQAPKK